MAGVVRIEIAESPQELLSYLKQADNQEVKERIQALYWLKNPSSRNCRNNSIFGRKTSERSAYQG
ncbi:hypothetical protein QM565_38065, partial [Geitlerinema splendidum]|nr:hypothetical protein [Geitlerinema splendidum]